MPIKGQEPLERPLLNFLADRHASEAEDVLKAAGIVRLQDLMQLSDDQLQCLDLSAETLQKLRAEGEFAQRTRPLRVLSTTRLVIALTFVLLNLAVSTTLASSQNFGMKVRACAEVIVLEFSPITRTWDAVRCPEEGALPLMASTSTPDTSTGTSTSNSSVGAAADVASGSADLSGGMVGSGAADAGRQLDAASGAADPGSGAADMGSGPLWPPSPPLPPPPPASPPSPPLPPPPPRPPPVRVAQPSDPVRA
jgi:hypothetical protein